MNATQRARLTLAIVIGISAGIAGYTFVYARGYSYLSNDPKACANCHIMSEQYSAWLASSHRSVAGCNDCHTPPDFVGKWVTKGTNGFWHSYYFTSGTFPDPIQITPKSAAITERACRKCHDEMAAAIDGIHSNQEASCLKCHRSVGHLH